MKIVAVTTCMIGAAHMVMAAQRLRKAGTVLSYETRVETQGAMGTREPLSEAVEALPREVTLREVEE